MELDRPYSSKEKCNQEGGYGVEPIRTKEKRKAKEELAENNMRGRLGFWKDMVSNQTTRQEPYEMVTLC
jgi:hypothetical protein